MSKLISIIGASARQGKAAAEALLKDGKWKVRGLVRDPTKAQDLAAKGVEILKVDFDDPLEVQKALEGSYGVFALTFWGYNQKKSEVEQGKILVDASKAANVTHFVFSSLPDVEGVSKGKYHVPHFTEKFKIEEYAKKQGFKYTSFPAPSFFFQNWLEIMKPREENGTLTFAMPGFPADKPLTAFDVDDMGPAVVNVLNNPAEWNGKHIPVWSTHATMPEIIKTFGEVLGKNVQYFAAPRGVAGEEIQNMIDWFAEYTYHGPESDLELGKKLVPNAKSLKDWIKESWK